MSEEVGENVTYTIKGNTLTITVMLDHEGGRSASGKTIRIASTEGNVKIDGTPAVMGLNVYKKPA